MSTTPPEAQVPEVQAYQVYESDLEGATLMVQAVPVEAELNTHDSMLMTLAVVVVVGGAFLLSCYVGVQLNETVTNGVALILWDSDQGFSTNLTGPGLAYTTAQIMR